MISKKVKKSKGLTIVETTIVVTLFSIILAAIFSALATANISWKAGGAQLCVQHEARRALNAMIKELRQANLSAITGLPADGSNYSSITFQIPNAISESATTWSSDIQYSIGGLNNTQLLRVQDGSQRVMANNISSFTLSRNAATPNIIDISITAQKETFPGFSATQTNITLNSEVKIRN